MFNVKFMDNSRPKKYAASMKFFLSQITNGELGFLNFELGVVLG